MFHNIYCLKYFNIFYTGSVAKKLVILKKPGILQFRQKIKEEPRV